MAVIGQQAVHVVLEVHGVGDADDPQQRQADVQHVAVEHADVDARQHQHPSGDELAAHLDPRHAVAVIYEAQQHEPRRPAMIAPNSTE